MQSKDTCLSMVGGEKNLTFNNFKTTELVNSMLTFFFKGLEDMLSY